MAAADDYDAAAALADFHESLGGVRGLVESGVAAVPRLFLVSTTPGPQPQTTADFAIPTVDLSLPRSETVALVRAAARSCGFFHVINHGVPPGTVDSAVSAVRAFHEQPRAIRSAFYSLAPVGAVTYSTIPIQPQQAGQPAAASLLPWRDSLRVRFGPGEPDLGCLPAACRDALQEYQRSLTGFGKEITGLLSEALGVEAERLEREMQVEGWLMACHYYPPCPEPARVVGSLEHTDPSLFTVLAQDGVGGLQVRCDDGTGGDGEWVDVAPVTGALLVNVGDVLKVVSNDEYNSVEHRVIIRSTQDARVSIACFFNPAKRDKSDLFGPLPELVTVERPARYRSFTVPEFMSLRREFGHSRSSIERLR
ncbi:1-aminocyclopropane-1-carboxylate oxidase homolog 1-like [Phragmites australis]|uniref:1-aminocyclopropane-1-carboxylate oxidase homolog 1-like n=1 Tax=Phragmites australis TaxID=29695 RepID=UPI002D7650F3|nr:1-aminocyclopropane-1-carboxylate oxidase homolog 1-like [Phragmites australis]